MTYLWTASEVLHTRSHLGVLIFMEYHRRFLKGKFGSLPAAIRASVFVDGGYCIDAPDHLPAGACHYFQCDAETGLPAQLEIDREPT